MNRAIIHADFDAFYASVEQRDAPELKGQPLVVGGSPEHRGVVASASYEARAFGIRSAIPMSRAVRLCPDLIRKSARFDVYRSVSLKVMDIFRQITDLVEPLSLDEAYLDVTEKVSKSLTPPMIAKELKNRVKASLDLTISVGVSTTKSVSKIASDMDKPDGIVVVRPGHEKLFLHKLPVRALWGIGPKTGERLSEQNILTVKDLSVQSDQWFESTFGVNGGTMKNMSLGIDNREVTPHRIRKSFSSETTLLEDTNDSSKLRELVLRLSGEVGRSLISRGIKGRTIKLKVKTSDFITITRQISCFEPVQLPSEISEYALKVLRDNFLNGQTYRLVGVGVSKFETIESEKDFIQMRFEGL